MSETVIFGANAWPLAIASVLCGIAAGWVFRRMGNQASITREKKRIQAHVLELWLFAAEPRVIWRAQISLIRANLRLLMLLAPAALIISIPMFLALAPLDAIYGRAPLRVGKTSVVTARADGPVADRGMDAPAAIDPDRPSVLIPSVNQISWRIRPLYPFSGKLRLRIGAAMVEQSVVTGEGPRYTEARWPVGPARSVEIDYPPAEIRWFGIQFSWLIWFLLISTPAALISIGR